MSHNVLVYLSLALPTVLKLTTPVCLGLMLFDSTGGSENMSGVHGLIWANLAFIAALIFHAGVTVNRVKNLESRLKDVERQEEELTSQGETLAELREAVRGLDRRFADTTASLDKRIDHIHSGIHDIRNLMMKDMNKRQ